jgi:cytoskeletal protein RodZ
VFEIGNSLREARLRRSVGFPQAEQATKIRSKYLRALEDEHFDQLPSPTYVKGFLQAYADYLGLDGRLYVDEYNSRFVVGDDWERRRVRVRPARRTRGIQTSIVVTALAAIAVVTIVVASAWSLTGGSSPTPAATDRTTTVPPAHAPVAYLRVDPLRGGSYVEIYRGSGPGGKLLFSGTIATGSTPVELTAKALGKKFWLDISAPADVAVTLGGKRIAAHGTKPETLTVNASGVHAG